MSRDARRRRIYRARVVRRRRSALAVCVATALTLFVIVQAQSISSPPQPESVRYDRRAAVRYANTWALKVNPEYWSSPDSDCANFVSQCLRAGGLWPIHDAGSEWRPNGTEFPSIAWVNCGAQLRVLSKPSASHSRYFASIAGQQPKRWRAGDVVYLGNVREGKVVWEHVIICAGKKGGEWVYNSHTADLRRTPLDHWYPAHFSEIRFCRVADEVTYPVE